MSYRLNATFTALLVGGCVLPARAGNTPIYGGVTFPAGTGALGSGTTGSGQTESSPSSSPTPGSETVGSGVGIGTATDVANNTVQYTQAQRFTPSGATLLNGLGGYTQGNATDAAGDAVGYSYISGGSGNRRAVYWAAGSSTPVTLNPLNLGTTISSGTASSDQAYYISSNGTGGAAIYGYATLYSADGTANLGTRAVRWDASGNALQLGNIGTSNGTATGTTNARAFAGNSSNTGVGEAFAYNGSTALGYRAVRWDASGNATQLGDVINNSTVSTTQNITATAALSVNTNGDAVGFGPTYDSSGNSLGNRAIVWHAGTTAAVQLAVPATYTNIVAGTANDYAFKINSKGEAVGTTTTTSSSNFRATQWDTSTGVATVLGDLPNYTTLTSAAFDVNDSGFVAGDIRDTSTSSYHAVVWEPNGTPVDLNTLIDPSSGWNLLYAYSISGDDWVSGVAQYTPDASTTYTRDFLLQLPATLVPEPSMLALAGLGGPTLLRRRAYRITAKG